MSIHDGHRQRMRERFLKTGIEGFSDHEVLEMLLFYCVPRKDTNEIAHNLINHFGSYTQVLQASLSELEKVEGVGRSIAMYIAILRESYRYLAISKPRTNPVIDSYDHLISYMRNYYFGFQNEVVYLLCLDAMSALIECVKITEGSINSASISIRKILDVALRYRATSVILAHNHPGGLAFPSDEDRETTYRLADTLSAAGIILADHIILSEHDSLSMVKAGLYKPVMF